MRDPSTTHGRAITSFYVARRRCVNIPLMGKSVATYVTSEKVVGRGTAYNVTSRDDYLHVPWFVVIPNNDCRTRSVPLSPLANLPVLSCNACDVKSPSIQTTWFLIPVGKMTSLTEVICFSDLPGNWRHTTTQSVTIISKSFPCHHSLMWHCIMYAVCKTVVE
jgi:hypothetical protein